MNIKDSDLLTMREVAKELRVSYDVIREMVRHNLIPHRKVGRQVRFAGWQILKWLDDGIVT